MVNSIKINLNFCFYLQLNLPSIRFGDIEDIVTTILDTLRIFKYSPPAAHSNP